MRYNFGLSNLFFNHESFRVIFEWTEQQIKNIGSTNAFSLENALWKSEKGVFHSVSWKSKLQLRDMDLMQVQDIICLQQSKILWFLPLPKTSLHSTIINLKPMNVDSIKHLLQQYGWHSHCYRYIIFIASCSLFSVSHGKREIVIDFPFINKEI